MNLKQAFKMSMQSVTANKVRSFLTMLGIIIGVAAVMIMVSVVQGGNKEMQEYYRSMGTNKIQIYAYRYNQVDMTEDIYRYCLTMPDLVAGFTPAGTAYATVRYRTTNCDNNEEMYGGPTIYLGSDQFSICNNYQLASGRDISYLDCERYNKVVVLGSKLKEYLFQAQDPVGQKITIGGQSFEVIGTYESIGGGGSYANAYDRMNYVAVVPYTASRYLETYGPPSQFVVKATSADTMNAAITHLGTYVAGLVGNNGDFQVYTDETWQQESQQQTNLQSMILGGIAGISLLVGGIGIMNIMLVTVTERTREIGIRKAIGGSRRSIIVQFLIEAAVLCGVGGIFGVILGYLGTIIAGKLLLQMEEILLPSAALTVGALAFSALLGVGFGMYPAVKASGLQPVDALRAE